MPRRSLTGAALFFFGTDFMAPTFSYPQLNEDTGTATANGLRNVANQAADFACNLYENYTDTVTGLPDPTGLGAALNGLYSNLCAPRGKTPTNNPAPPYTGGQCVGKNYNVTIAFQRPDNSTGSTFFPAVPGPLGSFQSVAFGSGGAYGLTAPNATAYNGLLPVVSSSGSNWRDTVAQWKVTNVTVVPTSGLDNCGDPAPQYRTPPPPQVNIRNTNNTVNVGGNLVVNAPITIIPVTAIANVAITPQIQVQVGPFDVTFDAGGVYVQPNITNNNTTNSPNTNIYNPPAPTPQLPRTPDNAPCDLSGVIAKIDTLTAKTDALQDDVDDVKDCACPVGYQVTSQAIGSGSSGVVVLPSNTIQVRLNLTTIPANAKIQDGGQNHPDFLFCGYVDFGDGTGLSERRPISVAQSTFECPIWATSFGWSLYLGYDCSVTAVKLQPDKAGAQLAYRQMRTAPA